MGADFDRYYGKGLTIKTQPRGLKRKAISRLFSIVYRRAITVPKKAWHESCPKINVVKKIFTA